MEMSSDEECLSDSDLDELRVDDCSDEGVDINPNSGAIKYLIEKISGIHGLVFRETFWSTFVEATQAYQMDLFIQKNDMPPERLAEIYEEERRKTSTIVFMLLQLQYLLENTVTSYATRWHCVQPFGFVIEDGEVHVKNWHKHMVRNLKIYGFTRQETLPGMHRLYNEVLLPLTEYFDLWEDILRGEAAPGEALGPHDLERLETIKQECMQTIPLEIGTRMGKRLASRGMPGALYEPHEYAQWVAKHGAPKK